MDSSSQGTHPMVIVAATTVTLASLTAIAWFAGLITSHQEAPPPVAAVTAPAPTPPTAAAATPQPVAETKASTPVAKTPTPVARDAPIPPPRRVERQFSTHDVTVSQYQYGAEAPVNDGRYGERPRPQYQYGNPPQAQYAQPPGVCRECGIVESVREIRQEGQGSGLGAVGGGVIGGLLGNQIGGGNGRTVGAVVGAVGGALAGNEVEKNVRASRHYDITVRFDDGNTRVFSQEQPPALQRGDRVRLANGQLQRF